jgi:hypothetical protein
MEVANEQFLASGSKFEPLNRSPYAEKGAATQRIEDCVIANTKQRYHGAATPQTHHYMPC